MIFGNEEHLLRMGLYDLGYKIPTNEMTREFYFKNRTSKEEREKLFEILKVLHTTVFDKHSPGINKHPGAYLFNFGVIAVGTSTYPDEYFSGLEQYVSDNHISKEDYIVEKAEAAMHNWQLRECNTYEDYLKWCKNPGIEEDKEIFPMSKEEFEDIKSKEEIPYTIKKKLKDILERKGEDLDFVIAGENEIWGRDYSLTKLRDLRKVFMETITERGYSAKEEEDCLWGVSYLRNPKTGEIIRYKTIQSQEHEGSCRISFEGLRSLHFYFGRSSLNSQIREERIENSPFCQIVRNCSVRDLEAAINNGEETGVFENPAYLGYVRAY
jgi:hypothetical protein